MKDLKVNLVLLKKLVAELEVNITAAEEVMEKKEDPTDYVVEMSKCAGLAFGVAQEASMLVGDIKNAIKLNTASAIQGEAGGDLLSDLFNLGKPDGGTNSN